MNPILVVGLLFWGLSRIVKACSTQYPAQNQSESVFLDDLLDPDMMRFHPESRMRLIYCECGLSCIPFEWEATVRNEECTFCGSICRTEPDSNLITVRTGYTNQGKPIIRRFDPSKSTDRFDFNREVGRAVLSEYWNLLHFDQGGLESMRIDQFKMLGHDQLQAEDLVMKGCVPTL